MALWIISEMNSVIIPELSWNLKYNLNKKNFVVSLPELPTRIPPESSETTWRRRMSTTSKFHYWNEDLAPRNISPNPRSPPYTNKFKNANQFRTKFQNKFTHLLMCHHRHVFLGRIYGGDCRRVVLHQFGSGIRSKISFDDVRISLPVFGQVGGECTGRGARKLRAIRKAFFLPRFVESLRRV